MVVPSASASIAGSRDCTTTPPSPANATAIGCPTTFGSAGQPVIVVVVPLLVAVKMRGAGRQTGTVRAVGLAADRLVDRGGEVGDEQARELR